MADTHLPNHMVIAYRQYKRDTERIAGWLATNASKVGFEVEPNVSIAPKQPRLKGRARKLARDEAKTSTSNVEPKHQYVVKTTDLAKMAKAIVASKSKTVLSISMQQLWQQTIETRQSFVKWFTQQAKSTVQEDIRHTHFVHVLVECLELLRPCWEVKSSQSVANSTPATSQIHRNRLATHSVFSATSNRFQCLEIEDIVEQDAKYDSVKSHSTATDTKIPLAHIDLNEKELESEFFFAIWAFMDDVAKVRLHVRSTWMLYFRGKMESMHAAVVTNFAIDLIRHAEAEFAVSLKRPVKYPAKCFPTGTLPSLLFYQHLSDRDHIPSEIDSSNPSNIVHCNCSKCGDLLHVPYVTASGFVQHLKRHPPKLSPWRGMVQVELTPLEIPQSDASLMGLTSFQDRAILLTHMNYLLMLSFTSKETLPEDEIMHAVRYLQDNLAVAIWVAFAFQIQLDLHHRPDNPAFCDAKAAYSGFRKKTLLFVDWITKLGIEEELPDFAESLSGLAQRVGNYFEGSPITTLSSEARRKMEAGGVGCLDMNQNQGLQVLEYFPLTCASVKLEMAMMLHKIGLTLSNTTKYLPSLCHLYNAAKMARNDEVQWADVELAIVINGVDKLFYGARPTTFENANQKFGLFMGFPLSARARSRRNQNVLLKDTRFLDRTIIGEHLYERIIGRETRKVDEAVFKLQQTLFDRKILDSTMYRMFAKHEIFIPSYHGDPGKTNANIVDMLTRVSYLFESEMPAFMFDHFAMARRCFVFFKSLDRDLRKRGITSHPVDLREPRPAVTVVNTSEVLRLAAKAETLFRKSPAKREKRNQAGTTLRPRSAENSNRVQSVGPQAVSSINQTGTGPQIDMTAVVDAMKVVFANHAHDEEVRKLKHLQGPGANGSWLFHADMLESLYGPNRGGEWEDVKLTTEELRRYADCFPDAPQNLAHAQAAAKRSRAQQRGAQTSHEISAKDKAVADADADTDADSGQKDDNDPHNMPRLRNTIPPLRNTKLCGIMLGMPAEKLLAGDLDRPAIVDEEKEDWEAYGDPYGREGNYLTIFK